jgi:hypothetical protein
MSNEPRVQELLDEILDSERTPEEVCGVWSSSHSSTTPST